MRSLPCRPRAGLRRTTTGRCERCGRSDRGTGRGAPLLPAPSQSRMSCGRPAPRAHLVGRDAAGEGRHERPVAAAADRTWPQGEPDRRSCRQGRRAPAQRPHLTGRRGRSLCNPRAQNVRWLRNAPSARRTPVTAGQAQAWPASLDSKDRSIPILAMARCHLLSFSAPNTRSRSAGTSSQPFAWISASSCPGAQPA
jgi:hypothetical protein